MLSTITRQVAGLSSGEGDAQRLARAVHERPTLLLLDNLEHLEPAVPDVIKLVMAAPDLTVLVTSRSPLSVPGERVLTLGPLREATTLFRTRATELVPDFVKHGFDPGRVTHLCALLDGLPLAVELAAAQLTILSLEELIARLETGIDVLAASPRSGSSRQRTLRATLDWSERLLSPQARLLLRRLTVFRDGWSVYAAEQVCSDEELPAGSILVVLGELQSRSLITSEATTEGPRRMRMLRTVRQFAASRLDPHDLRIVERKHVDWILGLAREAGPHLVGTDQGSWLRRLAMETGNLRIAMERTVQWATQSQAAPELAAAYELPTLLERFWTTSGQTAEGRQWLSRALGMPLVEAPRVRRARSAALIAASVLALLQQCSEEAQRLAAEGLALGEELDDPELLLGGLRSLGTIAVLDGDLRRGDLLLERSLTLADRLGPEFRHGVVWARCVLASSALLQSDLARARRLFEDCVAELIVIGDANLLSLTHRRLGQVALAQGQLERAAVAFGHSLRLNESMDNVAGVAASTIGLAAIQLRSGLVEDAARALGEAITSLERRGEQLSTPDSTMLRECVDLCRQQLGAERFERAMGAVATS